MRTFGKLCIRKYYLMGETGVVGIGEPESGRERMMKFWNNFIQIPIKFWRKFLPPEEQFACSSVVMRMPFSRRIDNFRGISPKFLENYIVIFFFFCFWTHRFLERNLIIWSNHDVVLFRLNKLQQFSIQIFFVFRPELSWKNFLLKLGRYSARNSYPVECHLLPLSRSR